MVTVRDMTGADHAAVVDIIETLVGWFDETARHHAIPIDLKHQTGFVAVEDDRPVGFITLYVAEGRLNIGWLGVRRDLHHRGIGTLLIQRAEREAIALGIAELATYTLSDSVPYAPYEPTRAFYFKNGFHVFARKRTDNPGCPEELWISKKVTPA